MLVTNVIIILVMVLAFTSLFIEKGDFGIFALFLIGLSISFIFDGITSSFLLIYLVLVLLIITRLLIYIRNSHRDICGQGKSFTFKKIIKKVIHVLVIISIFVFMVLLYAQEFDFLNQNMSYRVDINKIFNMLLTGNVYLYLLPFILLISLCFYVVSFRSSEGE